MRMSERLLLWYLFRRMFLIFSYGCAEAVFAREMAEATRPGLFSVSFGKFQEREKFIGNEFLSCRKSASSLNRAKSYRL